MEGRTKRIKARYTFDIEIDVPESMDKFEFELNKSDVCGNQLIDDVALYAAEVDGCMCHLAKAVFIEEVKHHQAMPLGIGTFAASDGGRLH